MAIKAVSDMTQEELEALRGKKSVKPLFELTSNRRDEIKPTEEVKKDKPKRERKSKKEKKVTETPNVSNSERKKETKEQNMDNNMDIMSMSKEKHSRKEQNMDTGSMSKKELREARKKKKEEEAKLYPNETKKERKSRLRREKIEAAAEEKLKELENHEQVNTRKNSTHSIKVLYDDNAHNKLIEIYKAVTTKKTKKEQEYDEVMRKHLKRIGLIVALHEERAGSERFAMMGKLVEKGYAAHKAYASEYHLYEILG